MNVFFHEMLTSWDNQCTSPINGPKLVRIHIAKLCFIYCTGTPSHGEAVWGVLNHWSYLGDLDSIAFAAATEFDVPNESVEIFTLEVWLEFLQKGSDISRVDELIFLSKLQLEEILDESLWVCIGVIHVRLNSVGEIGTWDVTCAPLAWRIAGVPLHS